MNVIVKVALELGDLAIEPRHVGFDMRYDRLLLARIERFDAIVLLLAHVLERPGFHRLQLMNTTTTVTATRGRLNRIIHPAVWN